MASGSTINEALVQAVRRALNDVNAVCDKELSNLCGGHVRLMQEANQTVHSNPNSMFLLEAVRHVPLCLATNVDELRPACIVHLVDVFLHSSNTPSPCPTPSPSGYYTKPPSPSDLWSSQTPSPWYPSSPSPSPTTRHIRRHDYDSSAAADGTTSPPPGVLVYVINNNGSVVIISPGNASMGLRTPPRDEHHHHCGGLVLLIVGIIVLPFFCIGLFVSTKRVIAYCRERRGYSSIEYLPLRANESSL